jgi:hypothetical protein
MVLFMRKCEKRYGIAGQATDDNIIRRMRFACWITKATDTHPEYVILIAYPRQQWLRERASLLRYTHNSYLFCLFSLTFSISHCLSWYFLSCTHRKPLSSWLLFPDIFVLQFFCFCLPSLSYFF